MPVNSRNCNRFLGLIGALLWSFPALSASLPDLDEQQAQWLGDRIFANECARKVPCLTSWNAGEQFPSLGIGHFIWYPAGQSGPFVETFPALLEYLRNNGVPLPDWLRVAEGAPWPDRETFNEQLHSDAMVQLRQLLLETKDLQIRFIVGQFYRDMSRLYEQDVVPPTELDRLIRSLGHNNAPHGIYALIDYVHFKGWGTAQSERYQGQGWGLLQVLETMNEQEAKLENFVAAATAVLHRRVDLAPPERNEQRWLAGWLNRVNTYLPADF
ncbi:MAG: hypothetical protein MI755_05880 [Sphingomonadales bacterium]|nr:hypothetical protein [Sphingomonadales bacterium]